MNPTAMAIRSFGIVFRAPIAAAMLLLVASPATAQSLREALENTLRTNPEVRIELAKRLATDEAVNQAASGYLPRVDLVLGKGSQRPVNATTVASYGGEISQQRFDRTLTLSQMLFDGMGTSSEVDRNRSRVESATHKLAYTSEQTALKAIEAYLEVLRQQEVIRLTKDNLAVHERTFDQIRLRASSGVGRKSDQDQIEARLALTKANLTAAEANLIVAKVNYKLTIGTPPGELTKPQPPDRDMLPKDSDEAVMVAMGNSRILQSAEADLDAAEAQHRAAKSFLYPRLDVELGIQHNDVTTAVDANRDDNKYAMVRFRYNLYKGGSDTARAEETRHQTSEAREILARAERQLEQSVRLSWNAYKSAVDRLPNLRKHADSSLLSRDAYAKQFSLGQRTLLDLLDTENEYYTASVNFLNGHYVELFSRYRVLADTGLLLDNLGVAHRVANGQEAVADAAEFPTRRPDKGARRAARAAPADDDAVLSANAHAQPTPIETRPPEPLDVRLPPLPATRPIDLSGAVGTTYVDVGNLLPAASAQKLRNRLQQLGFRVNAEFFEVFAADRLRISIGPYANAAAAAPDVGRLEDLGLTVRLRDVPGQAASR